MNVDELGDFAAPPYLMGIVNCTPDSFSDGGRYLSHLEAIELIERECGAADLLDIGGEASGPTAQPVSADVELARVLPLVESLAKTRYLSVDTFRASTAAACLAAGARMINDISALRFDTTMADVVREHGARLVLMYSKETGEAPHASKRARHYDDLISEIGDFLETRIEYALRRGISEDRLIVDPGMGAFVSIDGNDSWELLAGLDRLRSRFHSLPMLVGTSRKGFLGGPLQERDPLSQLTALIATLKGATIFRTHNPAMAKQFLESWQRTMG